MLAAFKHYAEWASMQEVTDGMNIKGICIKRGGKISINSVTRMLHNRKYIGEYKYRKYFHKNKRKVTVCYNGKKDDDSNGSCTLSGRQRVFSSFAAKKKYFIKSLNAL